MKKIIDSINTFKRKTGIDKNAGITFGAPQDHVIKFGEEKLSPYKDVSEVKSKANALLQLLTPDNQTSLSSDLYNRLQATVDQVQQELTNHIMTADADANYISSDDKDSLIAIRNSIKNAFIRH
ncbi:hypothetical protein KA017_03115 [Candidatus Woesebacteria bacterium]|nr:hypothetical protein [Candidatus Woesebacteria bacterium]